MIITKAAMEQHLAQVDGILRTYNIRMPIVTHVDDQGTQCTFCQVIGNEVAVNIYLTTFAGEHNMEACCTECVVFVLDVHHDTDPRQPVTIEIAEGAR